MGALACAPHPFLRAPPLLMYSGRSYALFTEREQRQCVSLFLCPGSMGDPCEVFPEIARHVHHACMSPHDAAANKDKQCSPLCWAHDTFW